MSEAVCLKEDIDNGGKSVSAGPMKPLKILYAKQTEIAFKKKKQMHVPCDSKS